MDPSIEEYLRQKMLERQREQSPEYQGMRAAQDRGMADQDAQGALAASLMKSAAQIGTIGGKVADATPVGDFADRLEQSRQLLSGRADKRRAEGMAEDDSQLKLMDYLEKRKAARAGAEAESAAAAAKRRDDLARQEREFGFKERELGLRQQDLGMKGRELEQSRALKEMEFAAKREKDSPTGIEAKTKALNAEQSKRLDNSAMAVEAIEDMNNALRGGSNTFSLIGDNPFTAARARFEEALGRMQSGGAINDEEAARFRKMAPTATDSSEIQAQKLQKMADEMGFRIKSLGFEPSEVMAYRKKSGYALPADTSGQAQAATDEKVVGGKRYKKVQGGWQEVK